MSNYNTNTTRVVSLSVQDGTSPPTPTHCRTEDTEPQDLTPIQPENVSLNQQISHSSPDTPGKKERNSRKQCPYCNKGAASKHLNFLTTTEIFSPSDFHEMSLKRHIKDVHFKNQNTYVICPQCCKQYASQNSLYSHLNRVSLLRQFCVLGQD